MAFLIFNTTKWDFWYSAIGSGSILSFELEKVETKEIMEAFKLRQLKKNVVLCSNFSNFNRRLAHLI